MCFNAGARYKLYFNWRSFFYQVNKGQAQFGALFYSPCTWFLTANLGSLNDYVTPHVTNLGGLRAETPQTN